MKKRDIQDIIECRKWSFENGEKKQFSGCLNHWINTSDEYSISWTFLYKQPVTYLVELLGDVRHSMTRRQQVLACIKQRLYKMPFYAYGQRITAWNVFSPINSPSWKGRAKLHMLSGDDDIYEFMLPICDIEKVKQFIQENYKILDYDLFDDFLRHNGYEL